MSQAAGAPPPPPPPPPNKKTSFEDLPTELFLYIIQFLRMGDYSQLALAIYPILECHGLVPPLSIETFNRITNPTPPPHPPRRDRRITLDLMPIELIFEIMEYLEPEDRIAFMFSHPEMFGRLFHMLSEETRARLWSVVRWSQQR